MQSSNRIDWEFSVTLEVYSNMTQYSSRIIHHGPRDILRWHPKPSEYGNTNLIWNIVGEMWIQKKPPIENWSFDQTRWTVWDINDNPDHVWKDFGNQKLHYCSQLELGSQTQASPNEPQNSINNWNNTKGTIKWHGRTGSTTFQFPSNRSFVPVSTFVCLLEAEQFHPGLDGKHL